MPDAPPNSWTLDQIRQHTLSKIDMTPCLWQAEAVKHQLEGHDVLVIAATGSGKTEPFLIPSLFDEKSLTIIISPLNVLSAQHTAKWNAKGVKTDVFKKDGITAEKLKVRETIISPMNSVLTRFLSPSAMVILASF